mmetsp:Transcript_7213/g.10751  ORF Transcript_7213/g.10751 Transcript_7213/m.10751 type:complete len:205 (-) Transcript_7213:912-1526(-)
MSLSSPLRRVSSRSSPLPVTLTWVVRTSTTVWSTTSSTSSSASTRRILAPTSVLSDVSEPLASVPSELFLLPLRPPLRSTLSSRVLTSTPPSPVPVSRSSARISSDPLSSPSTVSLPTPRSTSPLSTRSSSSVDLPVSPVSRSSSPTTSTERSPTSPSTPMRLLPTVPLSRLPFSLVTPLARPPTRSSSWMSPLSLSVLRPLVV